MNHGIVMAVSVGHSCTHIIQCKFWRQEIATQKIAKERLKEANLKRNMSWIYGKFCLHYYHRRTGMFSVMHIIIP
jgi:hypothetical protein